MSDDPPVVFVDRTEFAELAEALGINSDLVLSATMRPYGLLVLWTRSEATSEEIQGSVLRRDGDRIYRVVKTGGTGASMDQWLERVQRDLERDRARRADASE